MSRRPRPLSAACLLALLAAPSLAAAQSLGCIERPIGVPLETTVLVPIPQPNPQAPPMARGARAAVTLPPLPSHGTACASISPPPRDILQGDPPSTGSLLRGDSPREGGARPDLLRDQTPVRPPTGWSLR